MFRAEAEDFRPFFNRVRPVFVRMFNLAHAVTGNSDAAEYCLQSAMLECRDIGGGSSHAFRESLRACVLRTALKTALAETPGEFDWEPLPAVEGSPASALIAQESAQTQRMLILKYGCSLPPRRIARLCGTDLRHVKTTLSRFETRAKRKLSAPTRQSCAARITRAVEAALELPTPAVPDIGSTFRAFQTDANATPPPSRIPAKIAKGIVLLAFAAVCIAAFWLATVLLQPAVIVEDDVPAEVSVIEN